MEEGKGDPRIHKVVRWNIVYNGLSELEMGKRTCED